MTENWLIFYDARETPGGVPAELAKLPDIELVVGQPIHNTQHLEVGDYCLSVRCSIERKTIEDFWHTFYERNLFSQLSDLSASCKRPGLIIEGDYLEFWNISKIHPDLVRGILAAIQFDFRIPIIWTLSRVDTAAWLINEARREQDTTEKRKFNPHGKRSGRIPSKQLEYTITSIDGIGIETGINLLKHFGNIESIVKASVDELKEVKLVGEKTAPQIYEFLRRKYT